MGIRKHQALEEERLQLERAVCLGVEAPTPSSSVEKNLNVP